MIVEHVPTGAIEREPVAVFLAGLTAVIAAGLAATVSFDWLDVGQAGGLVAFVASATALAAAVIRARVTPWHGDVQTAVALGSDSPEVARAVVAALRNWEARGDG